MSEFTTVHDLLMRGHPNVAAEILRAAAFPEVPPTDHYANVHTLRAGGDVVPDQAAWWNRAWPHKGWPADEAAAHTAEMVADGAVRAYGFFSLEVIVGVWWDGDGTIFFHLTDPDVPTLTRMLVSHDSKKTYRWADIT